MASCSAIEEAEELATTLAERWQQTNGLLAMAITLRLDKSDRQERCAWALSKAQGRVMTADGPLDPLLVPLLAAQNLLDRFGNRWPGG